MKEPTSPMCQHCKLYRANRARGLCNRCYSRVEIRELYPIRLDTRSNNIVRSIFPPPPRVYKKHDVVDVKCQHDKWDGECPICEREQRKNLVVFDEKEYDAWLQTDIAHLILGGRS